MSLKAARLLRKGLAGISGVALGFGLAISISQPANAYTFNRSGAVNYAKTYACNGVDCSNANFIRLGADCANFVSQALHVGGDIPMIKNSSIATAKWFYSEQSQLFFPRVYTGSNSWVSVNALFHQLEDSGRLGSVSSTFMAAPYSGAQLGDVYMYDWGRGEGYSHVALATGQGVFGSYFDPQEAKNYTWITGGSGSKLAQHTTDRDGAPWNWGYWTEGDYSVRAKMRTVILRING